MTLIISAGTVGRNEISQLSAVSNWLISQTTSKPAIGQVDDSIAGNTELTRSDVRLNKYHAELLFSGTSVMPNLGDVPVEGITGRECVSMLLADTPINLSRGTTWYNPSMAPYVDYDPDEIRLNIVQGKITSGVLDKSSIGKGADGGLYHVIANEYGTDKSLSVMHNMQRMSISYVLQKGYTIGAMDILLPHETKTKIDQITTDLLNKSKLITEELHNGEIIPPIGRSVISYYEERQINTLSITDDFTPTVLSAINPKVNNLFKLVQCGSKGKFENVLNIVSAIGQKSINGKRTEELFGYGRTHPTCPRFDTSAESRGYVRNSFLAGMNSLEYWAHASAARFDLIMRALSTALAGEQSRKSIKNLESVLADNLRRAVTSTNVIQFAYGDDYLDPRKVEKVKFPTINLGHAEFEARYKHENYPAFFEQMKADRFEYRRIFITIERMNIRDLMSDERRMPVDVNRTIIDVVRSNARDLRESTPESLAEMVQQVEALCANISYVLVNEIQERTKMELPEHILRASWLLKVLIRSYLHPRALEAHKITPVVLRIIADKIRLRYSQALIEPGAAVGTIAAMSFSEPLTQYMLDATRGSVAGGSSKSGMTTAREILSAREVSKLKNPSMLIPVLPEYAGDEAKVREIASGIEALTFKQTLTSWQIFAEKFKEPVHSQYKHEKAIIDEFLRNNPLMKPPNLARWCIRFALNKSTLILKSVPLELIISKLRESFPDIFVVYTPENAKQIILRVYLRSLVLKANTTVADIRNIKDHLAATVIRGVEGIVSASVVKMVRSKMNPDGAISQNDKIWGITTVGTNMRGILLNPFIDKYQVQTDALQERCKFLGIGSACMGVESALRGLVEGSNPRHYKIYARMMSLTGKLTPIEASGVRARGRTNALLLMGYSSPIAALEKAAVDHVTDDVTGITAPLLIGGVPHVGTLYNTFHVDPEFIRANTTRTDDIIDSLFD